MVRKIRTDQTQVLHCFRLPFVTPKKPIPDVQTTSQEWKLDPEFINKQDGWYARDWEFDFVTPMFDNEHKEPSPHNPREVQMQSDNTNAETYSTLGTTRERCLKTFPPRDGLYDKKNPYTEYDVAMSSRQSNPNPINPTVPKTIYVTTRSLTVATFTDIKLYTYLNMFHRMLTYAFQKT